MEKLTGVSEITAVINDQHAKYQDLNGRLGILSRLNHRLKRREGTEQLPDRINIKWKS